MSSAQYNRMPEEEYELPLTQHDAKRSKHEQKGKLEVSSGQSREHTHSASASEKPLSQAWPTLFHFSGRIQDTLAYTFRTRLRKALAAALILLLILHISAKPSTTSQLPVKLQGIAKGWGYSVKSGETIMLPKKPEYNDPFNPDDLTFTEEQCDAYFPDLWKDIDRSVKYYTKNPFTKEYLESSCDDGQWTHARVAIYNNRLYLKKFTPSTGTFTRPLAALALLHQSIITSREPLPNIEFCMGFDDWGMRGKFSLDRRDDQDDVWLMPDYGFLSWPEHVGTYLDVRMKIEAIEKATPWEEKVPKLFWRGSMKVGTADRESMVQVARGHTWNDIKGVDWSNPTTAVAIADHCKWKFQGFAEGNTYSGRLRYLQNCKTVIITHPPRWIQHWTHLYNADWNSPDQNIVYVPKATGNGKGVLVHDGDKEYFDRTWERLPDVMDALLKDDDKAHRIAENQWNYFRNRYVSPASAACYWRKAIKGFGKVQKYTVDLSGQETSYESFMLLGMRDGKGHNRRSNLNSSDIDRKALELPRNHTRLLP